MTSIRLHILSLATLLAVAAAPVQAAFCHPVAVTGKSEEATSLAIPTKSNAQGAARGAWEKKCNGRHPGHHCVWQNAARKKIDCRRLPNGIGGYNHSCTYTGRPCVD